MKQTFIAFFTFFFFVTLCNAQRSDTPGQSVLSFELGKTGLIYNLNFDHKFGGSNLGYRVEAGSNFSQYLNVINFGGGGYYLIGKRNRCLELGIDLQYLVVDEVSDDQEGFTLVYPDYSIKTFYPSMNIGYRSYSKATMFRIGFSPGVIDSKFLPGGYISFGFKL